MEPNAVSADACVADPSDCRRKRQHNTGSDEPELTNPIKRPCLSVSALAISSSAHDGVRCIASNPSPVAALRVHRYITTNALLVSLRIASMLSETDECEHGPNANSRRFVAICNAVFADSVRSASYLDVNVVDHEGVPLAFRIVSAIFGPLNETDYPEPIDKELYDDSRLGELQRDTRHRDIFITSCVVAERNRVQAVEHARVLLRTFDARLLDGRGRNMLNWVADCCSQVFEIIDSSCDPIMDELSEGGWLEHLITDKQLDVNRRVPNENEPCLLQLATHCVPAKVLIFLIRNGACVHLCTTQGNSLLHLLAMHHNYQTLEALFVAFELRMFEFNARNADNKTPLDLAKIHDPSSLFVEPNARDGLLMKRVLRTIQVLSIECMCKD